jgi:hypothetical protein
MDDRRDRHASQRDPQGAPPCDQGEQYGRADADREGADVVDEVTVVGLEGSH